MAYGILHDCESVIKINLLKLLPMRDFNIPEYIIICIFGFMTSLKFSFVLN